MAITALRVPDVRSYRFVGPNTPDAPKLSRDHVGWLLRHARSPVAVDVAELLVSELVTNAYQHTTAARVSVTTTIEPGGVRVDVHDDDPRPLPVRMVGAAAPLTAEHGRGLFILQRLAARWSWEAGAPGKSVWFELGQA